MNNHLNDDSNKGLLPFIVLYTTAEFNVPEPSLFYAENTEHAEEQMENEQPGCSITWVVQTDSAEVAFDDYHNLSTFED